VGLLVIARCQLRQDGDVIATLMESLQDSEVEEVEVEVEVEVECGGWH
jgi:hypothetical protein